VIKFVEDLLINCGDEENWCWILCDEEHREYYEWF